MGTFLDFTRLYVYVHWMFYHFVFVNEILAKKYKIAQWWRYCTHLDIWIDEKKKRIILDIVTLVLFLHGPNGRTVFLVLCSNVVWNPFLIMKTTFTSDFSWFESVFVKIWEHRSSVSIFTFKRCIESFFFYIATCSNSSPQSLCFPATVLVRWIF